MQEAAEELQFAPLRIIPVPTGPQARSCSGGLLRGSGWPEIGVCERIAGNGGDAAGTTTCASCGMELLEPQLRTSSIEGWPPGAPVRADLRSPPSERRIPTSCILPAALFVRCGDTGGFTALGLPARVCARALELARAEAGTSASAVG